MRLLWGVFVLLMLLATASPVGAAGGDVVNCTVPLNISDSPGYTSGDPLVLADPAGGAHLFWAERVQGQPDASPNVPDTLMYSHYDGKEWSKPVDLFLSPRNVFNRLIGAPRAVLDEQGIIRLVWMGPDYRLYYSSAPAVDAGSASGWKRPYLVARDQSGTQYSADIAVTSPSSVHILYGTGTGGGALDDNRTNRAVTYVRSEDGGNSWTNPVDIYTFDNPQTGASNIRLLADPNGPLYATWTKWDASGNGQEIYFSRSLDDGKRWQPPVLLDRRVGDEYERDWTNLAVLDQNLLMAMWEGGYRAYPQAQYSQDGGKTWSRPIDTFYWLIADNGPAQFIRDSANRVHVFLMRRIREGYEDRCDIFPGCQAGASNAIWHSSWAGETRWREPLPLLFTKDNYVSAALVGGNQVLLATFGYEDPDVKVMTCDIEGAEPIAARPWPTPTAQPEPSPSPTNISQQNLVATATPAPRSIAAEAAAPSSTNSTLQMPMLIGVAPALAVVAVALIAGRVRRRS